MHFEVYTDVSVLDPWDGPCQFTPNTTLWIDDLPYDTSFGILNYGVFEGNAIPTLDTIREPYFLDQEYIEAEEAILYASPTTDTLRTAWYLAKGVLQGDRMNAVWLNEAGDTLAKLDYTADRDYWYFYNWTVLPMTPDERYSETTITRFFRNNQLVKELTVRSKVSSVANQKRRPFQVSYADDKLILSTRGNQPLADVKLDAYDLTGKRIPITHSFTAGEVHVNRPNVPAQWLVLKVHANNEFYSVKWFITP